MSGECSLGKSDPRNTDDILREQLRSFYVWPEWAEGPQLHCPDRRPRQIKLLEVGTAFAAGALQAQIAYRDLEERIRAEAKRLVKAGAFPPMTYVISPPLAIEIIAGPFVDQTIWKWHRSRGE